MGAEPRGWPWRPSCLALLLLPVTLPLLLLCLPLLCAAVAVVRFRRRRRRLLAAAAAEKGRCRAERPAAAEGEGHRAELLRKYLQDQMELVGAAPARDGAMDRPPSRGQQQHGTGHD